MILSDDELRRVRQSIEAHSGLDETLVQRCGQLLHLGAYDEAVRSAFVLLEERLREALNEEGLTGTVLANQAFSPHKGPLAKLIGHTLSEREGLRELYSGAFKLFRNPTAHGVVGYTPAEGKAIISLVDLLLPILDRTEAYTESPENVEGLLSSMEKVAGAGAASRLRQFLTQSVNAGIRPSAAATRWIPFKRHGFIQLDGWDQPRWHPFGIFYVDADPGSHELSFPRGYYEKVVGFDTQQLLDDLAAIGITWTGTQKNPRVDLVHTNGQAFFDALFELIVWISAELDQGMPE